MKSVLDPLLQSPQLPEYVDSLNRALALERRRRERFYDELTEDGKFEFINGKVVMHSPAKRKHIAITMNLSQLLSTFAQEHNLGEEERNRPKARAQSGALRIGKAAGFR